MTSWIVQYGHSWDREGHRNKMFHNTVFWYIWLCERTLGGSKRFPLPWSCFLFCFMFSGLWKWFAATRRRINEICCRHRKQRSDEAASQFTSTWTSQITKLHLPSCIAHIKEHTRFILHCVFRSFVMDSVMFTRSSASFSWTFLT